MKTLLYILIILSLLAGLLFLYTRDFMHSPTPPERPYIIAHRGASGIAPENTLAAVRKALEAGVDMIEVDLHLSKDGEVIVIHDDRLDRTTDGKGMVKDQLLPDLKALDAGSWKGQQFVGEAIPTLGEVMDLVAGRCFLLLEIKKHKLGYYEGIERAVLDHIYERKAESWCIIQSFHTPILDELKVLDPEIPLHKLLVADVPLLPLYQDGDWQWENLFTFEGVQALNPNYRFLNLRYVNTAHDKGYKVFVYTVDDPSVMRKVTRLGVDGIITNYPSKALELQRRM